MLLSATPLVTVTDAGGVANGTQYAATATVTGTGGVTVSGTTTETYYVGSTANGTGSTTAPSTPGVYTVVGSFTSSDPNYGDATSDPVTFIVSPPNVSRFDANMSGTYNGTNFVSINGNVTSSAAGPTSYTATIHNGAVTGNIAGAGPAYGTVDANGNITGFVNMQVNGVTVPVQFSGTVSAANASGTTALGTWTYSQNLGGGVIVNGEGTWSSSSPELVSDFDGSYAGSYQGSTLLNNNGTKTTSTVANTSYTATISNGNIAVTFPPSSGLSPGVGTVDAKGHVVATTSFVTNGVTIRVTFIGTATRTLSGIQITGNWTFYQNFGGGIVYSGKGTATTNLV